MVSDYQGLMVVPTKPTSARMKAIIGCLRLPGLDGGADEADQRENESDHQIFSDYQGLMVVPTKPISARTNANMSLLPFSCSPPRRVTRR
ncbi:hypothetical protein ACMGDM_14185 [Sphingomonas sp. DT-51]|uniref:hypothetical protein n=1 Tax=Sphingomonas sp. DT-51 TaxID=3396165 RepID=UPI003F1CB7C5